jgi:DNA-binding NtrC family response regulator
MGHPAWPVLDLDRAAGCDLAVWIEGETGTGKEVVAERIHEKSARAGRPLVRVRCGGVAEAALEAELFGSLTGGGSLYLDEIGELPLALQARLVSVLDDKAYDVRFIAATSRPFGGELHDRLAGVTIVIPPLRERPGEIAALARAFIADAGRALRLSPAALARLLQHRWPGNIRELENVIDAAVALALGDVIDVEHVVIHGLAPLAGVDALEKRRIVETLEAVGGNQTRAAQALGISRGTLLARLKQYGIKRPRS